MAKHYHRRPGEQEYPVFTGQGAVRTMVQNSRILKTLDSDFSSQINE